MTFETLAELLKWLATAGATGVVASLVMEVLKELAPQIKDRVAVLVSISVAVAASALATYLLPFMDQLPPALNDYWWILVWAGEQLYYLIIMKDHSDYDQ